MLQASHLGYNRPAVSRRNLMSVRWHHAHAMTDYIKKVAVTFPHQPLFPKHRRRNEAALDDASLTIALQTMAGFAKHRETIGATGHQLKRGGDRCYRERLARLIHTLVKGHILMPITGGDATRDWHAHGGMIGEKTARGFCLVFGLMVHVQHGMQWRFAGLGAALTAGDDQQK